MDFIMVPIVFWPIQVFVYQTMISFGLSSSISSFETTGNLETAAALSCCCFGLGSGGLEIGGTAAIFGEKLATI